ASLAADAGVTIEHISKPHVRKEDVVARVLQHRGDHPGLVHIISAMEACDAYKPWHDKQSHKTFIRPDSGKCLHYYFYFMDARFGLIYLRVPTPGSSPGAGSGHRSACNSPATATTGWHASWPPMASATPWPTTPSCGSTTGRVPRRLPTAWRRSSCIAHWIAMSCCVVRSPRYSGRTTTGA